MLARATILAVLGTLMAVTATAVGAGAPPTQRLEYSPFGADGSLRAGLHAVDRDGECFTSSSLVGRSGVYRCITANLLRDPCYGAPAADPPVVICAAAPWDRTVIRITLDKELPSDPPIRIAGRPWALELASGARCLFTTGVSNVVGGYRLNYFCSHRRFLFGSPRTSTPTWRIRQARSSDGRRMRLVAIARAWR